MLKNDIHQLIMIFVIKHLIKLRMEMRSDYVVM